MVTADRSVEIAPRGQVLVVVALGMVVFVGMVGLVIDGGFAWGKQRDTQNAADAAAESGAAALAERLAGINRDDTYVWTVVQRTGVANGVPEAGAPQVNPYVDCADGNPPAAGKDGLCAYYTDPDGALLVGGQGHPIAVGSLGAAFPPTEAAGVLAHGRQTFDTFLAGVVGIDRWDTTEPATAVAGYVSEGMGLPLTVPVVQFGCGSTSELLWGSEGFPSNTSYPYVLPLCSNAPGNIGWLDYSPPSGGTSEIVDQIKTPQFSIPVPSWQFVAQTGNTNASSVEDAMRSLDGQVVLFPQFDVTCNTMPVGTESDPNHGCPPGNVGGNGQNQWYHLPQFAAFQLCGADGPTANWCSDPYTHGTYFTGNDWQICDPVNKRATSCLIGRFVSFITDTTVTGNVGANSGTGLIGVQLIR
jgi:hypothetical protein